MATHLPAWRDGLRLIGRRGGALLGGAALLALTLMLGFALASYHVSDPAMNTAAGGPAQNIMGPAGAWIADLSLSLFGPSAALLPPLALLFGLRLWRGAPAGHWKKSLLLAMAGVIVLGIGLALFRGGSVSGLPAGYGGALGLAGAAAFNWGLAQIDAPAWATTARIALMLLLGLTGIGLWLWGLGLDAFERGWLFRWRGAARAGGPEAAAPVRRPREQPRPASPPAEPSRSTVITEPARAAPNPSRGERERQAKLDLRDTYTLPTLDLLKPAPPAATHAIDKAGLERNARLLESVLDDFHVKGHIVEVRPGPVVTMYELEPAAGIKASRVIALSDDIARNMSALSARVATIPGRSVIGIELPNARR